jgi:RNA polymerase sigma-70 factor (ECF subfamily)
MHRDVVQRAMVGDFDAFAELAAAAASRQYAVATLILQDRDRAHDAVQDALLAAWRGIRALREPDAWEAWLHRLTVRACISAARRQRRRSLVELSADPEIDVASPVDDTSAFAERDRMERELGLLPIDQRAVIVLHYYVGLPLTEAALALEIPPGTAKSRLHRGLGTLRRAMTAEHPSPAQLQQERPA